MRTPLMAVLFFALTAAGVSGLSIELDYRFDNGYFSDNPQRKIPLEYAASLWEKVIVSPAHIPAGTSVSLRPDYTKPGRTRITFTEEKKAFVIFVYAYNLDRGVTEEGGSSPSSLKAFGGNYGPGKHYGYIAFNTHAGRPWFFDATPETEYDVPVKDAYDLITSAVHEIGHALGFMRSWQEPYIVTIAEKDQLFDGPASRRVNDGNPIPMEYDSAHIRGDWYNPRYLPTPPIDRHVMHTGDPVQGYRQVMTAIDLAVMEDVGWEVDYSALPRYPYTPKSISEKKPETFGVGFGLVNPVGLWLFNEQEFVDGAIIGYPLRYSPQPGESGGMKQLYDISEEAIRVPKGGWLYISPAMGPNGGGKNVNNYTLVFDVKIEQAGVYYALFNTNPLNRNDADTFINKEGRIGAATKGYGDAVVPVNKWNRIVVVVNGEKGYREYYLNGKYSHSVHDVALDGRWSVYPKADRNGFFTLFGDDDGEDGDILVRSTVLYDTALSKNQAIELGGPENLKFGLLP